MFYSLRRAALMLSFMMWDMVARRAIRRHEMDAAETAILQADKIRSQVYSMDILP